jgi:hypothetical protein
MNVQNLLDAREKIVKVNPGDGVILQDNRTP